MATRAEILAEIAQLEEIARRNLPKMANNSREWMRSDISESSRAELKRRIDEIDRENQRCWDKIDRLRAQLEKLPK